MGWRGWGDGFRVRAVVGSGLMPRFRLACPPEDLHGRLGVGVEGRLEAQLLQAQAGEELRGGIARSRGVGGRRGAS